MLALTAAALTAGAPGPAAVASPATTTCPAAGDAVTASRTVDYRFGGLSEGVLTVRVPVRNVRHLVPPRYALLGESTGTATVVAAFGSVDALRVGCGNPTPAVVSEYGVFVDSPDGTSGRHAYYLWQLSDDRALVNRMRMLGAPAHYAESAFSAVSSQGGAVSIAAETLWREAPNRMTATASEPSAERGPSLPGVRFWYDGPRGTVRVAYECPDCLPRTPASGTVAAAPGTSLDAVLGGTQQRGTGFFIRTDLVARAVLLPSP